MCPLCATAFVRVVSLSATITLLLGLSAIVGVGLAAVLVRHRREPGGTPLALMSGFVACWALANALQINATDRDLKRATVVVAFAFICGTVYCFWRAITERAPWPWRVPGALATLLAAPAIVTVVLVSATDAPGPFFRTLEIPDGTGPVTAEPGPWFILHMLWAYGLMIWALAGFAWLALQAPRTRRRQSALMVGGVASPLVVNAVLATGATPLDGHDPTPIAAVAAAAGLALAIRRLRLLDVDAGLLPVARDSVVESMSEGVVVLDRGGRVVDMNPAAERLLGVAHRTAVAAGAASVLPGWRPVPADDDRWEFGVGAPAAADQRRIEVRTGALRGRGRRTGTLVLLRDVTDQAVAREALERSAAENLHASRHDPLTGLPNRTMLFGRLREALADGGGCALLILDLDGFKGLNDTFGHRAGDRVLRELAVRLQHAADADALVARLAGDEFAVMTAGPGRAGAAASAARMLGAFRVPFTVGETEVTLGASIGVAFGPEHGTDADDLVHAADVAMYHAKRTAGRSAVYHADLDVRRPERLILRHELRRALVDHELELHYQPLAAADGEVRAMEALVRWRHPERGLLMPDAFLPVIEDTDLICRLTDEVLDLALADLARWRESRPALRLAVNVSSLDLRDPALHDRVSAALLRHDAPASSLTLEITENALIVARDGVSQLERLREGGVRVSLDDFGTGVGPLTTLRDLPVDELKIDRSFVAGMEDRRRDAALVGGLIRMGHDLGLDVVAEGVETEAGATALRALGCDLLQGYLVGRPEPWRSLGASVRPAATTHPAAP